jgi:short-subunit dehydrogenase
MASVRPVVWITGASSGIGEALAYRYARAGAELVLSSRREDELRRVATACPGVPVHIVPLDLARPETMVDAAQRATALAGTIDVMVHNGGLSQRATAVETAYAVDDLMMRTNCLGPIALTKALLPSMMARRRGHFVVITSVAGRVGLPNRTAYCASKFALDGFFRALRLEVSPHGIDVTLVMPGYVRTRIGHNALTGDGRHADAEDPDIVTGMDPETCAGRIFEAASARRRDVYVGGMKERAALLAGRWAPRVLESVLRARARSKR